MRPPVRQASLRLARVDLDLFQNFQELVGLANVNDREIRHDTCDEQQAPNDVLHCDLLHSNSLLDAIIHKGENNSIL